MLSLVYSVQCLEKIILVLYINIFYSLLCIYFTLSFKNIFGNYMNFFFDYPKRINWLN